MRPSYMYIHTRSYRPFSNANIYIKYISASPVRDLFQLNNNNTRRRPPVILSIKYHYNRGRNPSEIFCSERDLPAKIIVSTEL